MNEKIKLRYIKKYNYIRNIIIFNRILFVIILSIFISLPVIFYSCCADEQCSEEDTYGKTIVHKTDTLYEVVQKHSRGPMSVQIGSFANENYANRFANIARDNLRTSVKVSLSREGLYRILIGEFNDINAAREILSFVKNNGYNDSFIRDEFGEIER